MTSTGISEDDIIKKRLLIEGDSGNEDKLINKLIKNFVTWTNNVVNSEANQENAQKEDENVDSLHEQLVASVSHAEFGLMRNQFELDMNKMEQENNEELYKKINNEIERAKKKIVESKVDLVEARKIRKNRQEYDIIARQILKYPNRAEMQTTIKNLEEKVESLKKSGTEYDRKIDLRRKQFSVVLQSLSSLKNLIETDMKFDEYVRDQTEMVNNEEASSPGSPPSNAGNLNSEIIINKNGNDLLEEIEEENLKVESEEQETGTKVEQVAETKADVEMEEAL